MESITNIAEGFEKEELKIGQTNSEGQKLPKRPIKFGKDGEILTDEDIIRAARIAEIRRENAKRPVAQLNKNDLWKSMGDYLMETGMEDLLECLQQLKETDPKGFITEYTKILKFFKPSMQSASVSIDSDIKITLTDARIEAEKEGYIPKASEGIEEGEESEEAEEVDYIEEVTEITNEQAEAIMARHLTSNQQADN